MHNALSKMNRVLDLFRGMDNVLPMQVVSVFLAIANNREAIETRHLPNMVGLSQASVNRALIYLQEHHWKYKDKPGLRLIVQRVHHLDARQRLVELTPRGEKVVNQIKEIIDG